MTVEQLPCSPDIALLVEVLAKFLFTYSNSLVSVTQCEAPRVNFAFQLGMWEVCALSCLCFCRLHQYNL